MFRPFCKTFTMRIPVTLPAPSSALIFPFSPQLGLHVVKKELVQDHLKVVLAWNYRLGFLAGRRVTSNKAMHWQMKSRVLFCFVDFGRSGPPPGIIGAPPIVPILTDNELASSRHGCLPWRSAKSHGHHRIISFNV